MTELLREIVFVEQCGSTKPSIVAMATDILDQSSYLIQQHKYASTSFTNKVFQKPLKIIRRRRFCQECAAKSVKRHRRSMCRRGLTRDRLRQRSSLEEERARLSSASCDAILNLKHNGPNCVMQDTIEQRDSRCLVNASRLPVTDL